MLLLIIILDKEKKKRIAKNIRTFRAKDLIKLRV